MQVDGNISWSGGMDASRSPSNIAENQYHKACNVQLRRSGGGISSRDGIHNVRIDFNGHKFLQEQYETGHVQAEGWFNDGYEDYLLCAVNGWVIKFQEINEGYYSATLVNSCDQNNPNLTKGWFTRVPYGAIYNDGESLPLWITSSESRRTDPSIDEIGVGRSGVYVQNRFFYISEDGKEVYFSDFRNPLSRAEAIGANLLSFVVPEDEDEITAIAKQKAMINYVEGGVLIFSTLDNIYSVDVRGPINSWETQGSSVGRVQESIRGVGASSSYSFESFNTNIYFRSREFGICDLRQSQFQFTNDDDLTSQSIEADYWLSNDTEWMLDQCYTRGYKGRLYTTIAPEFREDGYVFWNGMIVYHPDPKYSNRQQGPRRFEGIVTGVRPWCITAVKSQNRRDRLFIHSHDCDGVNRLYQFTDTDYDQNHRGKRVEIESWIETRGYSFGSDLIPKVSKSRFYKLKDIPRDLRVKVFSRTESSGFWSEYYRGIHYVGGIRSSIESGIQPANIKPQSRNHVSLPEEKSVNSDSYGGLSGNEFYSRQDRFEFKGAYTLSKFVRHADQKEDVDHIETEKHKFQSVYDYKPDFGYCIATANEESFDDGDFDISKVEKVPVTFNKVSDSPVPMSGGYITFNGKILTLSGDN